MSAMVQNAPAGMTPKAAEKYFSVLGRYERMRENTKKADTRIIRTVASFSTGFALGWAEGYYEYEEIAGVPIAAAIGLGANIAAFFFDEGMSEHLHNIGNAASAVYGRDWAAERGKARKQQESQKSGGGTGGGTTAANYTPYNSART